MVIPQEISMAHYYHEPGKFKSGKILPGVRGNYGEGLPVVSGFIA